MFIVVNKQKTEDKRQRFAMEIIGVTRSAFHYLRAKIITGELPAGQKLNENQLSSLLDISHPPLREAFRLLEHEHLVVNVPRKGICVTTVSREDLREVYNASKCTRHKEISIEKGGFDIGRGHVGFINEVR